MKINKFETDFSFHYYYHNVNHGLTNNNNEYIGYVYQDKIKGFWLWVEMH
jgi:hypothetical protein